MQQKLNKRCSKLGVEMNASLRDASASKMSWSIKPARLGCRRLLDHTMQFLGLLLPALGSNHVRMVSVLLSGARLVYKPSVGDPVHGGLYSRET